VSTRTDGRLNSQPKLLFQRSENGGHSGSFPSPQCNPKDAVPGLWQTLLFCYAVNTTGVCFDLLSKCALNAATIRPTVTTSMSTSSLIFFGPTCLGRGRSAGYFCLSRGSCCRADSTSPVAENIRQLYDNVTYQDLRSHSQFAVGSSM
jgi:hypothetical protein